MMEDIKEQINKEGAKIFALLDEISEDIRYIEKTFIKLPIRDFTLDVKKFGSGRHGDSKDEVRLKWLEGRLIYDSYYETLPLMETKARIRLDMAEHLESFAKMGLNILRSVKEEHNAVR